MSYINIPLGYIQNQPCISQIPKKKRFLEAYMFSANKCKELCLVMSYKPLLIRSAQIFNKQEEEKKREGNKPTET